MTRTAVRTPAVRSEWMARRTPDGQVIPGSGTWTYDYVDDVGDGWVVVLHFSGENGSASLTEFAVRWAPNEPDLESFLKRRAAAVKPARTPPDSRMTARRRRAIRIGQIEAEARRALQDKFEHLQLPDDWGARQPKRAAKGELTDRSLAELAVRYAELASDPNPVQQLAEELQWSRSTIRNRLALARERGLLTRPGQGRAGGMPTAKTEEVLDGVD